MKFTKISFIILLILFNFSIFAQTKTTDTLYYRKYVPDSLLKLIRELNNKQDSILNAKKDSVLKEIRKEKKERRKNRKVLGVNLKNIKKPESPDAFKKVFHFPPVAQHLTGTCWSFSTTSFFESEVYRLTGQKIKLSEIYTVYWEYIEKIRRYIRRYGNSYVAEGSEAEALIDIWKKYGIVPEEAYTGILPGKKYHDHSRLINEITSYLDYIKENNIWDEDYVLSHVKLILNRYLGEPPKEFKYRGKKYTPKSFLKKVLKLNMDDYIPVVSTKRYPFYKKVLLDVPDNWRRSEQYYNLPLDIFYKIIKESIKKGYSIAIGGDVSEPGYDGYEDIAIVPECDIPQAYINQDSREFRIYNRTTTDDHGIHIVGYTTIDDHDWFLIKDSSRSARKGKFEGYLFYRDDYIKLKMLSFLVHKDCVKKYLK